MPAPPLANTLNGPDATGITTGNSGGTLGDAFTNVTAGTGVTINYSATQAQLGAASASFFRSGNNILSSWFEWNGLAVAGSTDIYMRFYYYAAGTPVTGQGNSRVAEFLTQAGAQGARLLVEDAGGGGAMVAAGSGAFIPSTAGSVTIATNQWIRMEWRVRASTTAGEIEWRLFNDPNSTTPDDTIAVTGQALGADIGTARFGPSGSSAPFPSGTTGYYDEVGVSTAGWLGPATAQPVWAYQPRRMPIA